MAEDAIKKQVRKAQLLIRNLGCMADEAENDYSDFADSALVEAEDLVNVLEQLHNLTIQAEGEGDG